MPDFDKDLADGHRAEAMVLALVQRKYPRAYRVEGEFKQYDIFVPENGYRIEVKNDRYAPANGRIAVEVMYNGEQSGVYTTTAHQWVFVVGKRSYWIDPSKLCIAIQGKSIIPTSGNSGVVLLELSKVPWESTITLDEGKS